jgi:hypothetical protein
MPLKISAVASEVTPTRLLMAVKEVSHVIENRFLSP